MKKQMMLAGLAGLIGFTGLILASFNAQALTIGDIELKSVYGQRFSAHAACHHIFARAQSQRHTRRKTLPIGRLQFDVTDGQSLRVETGQDQRA